MDFHLDTFYTSSQTMTHSKAFTIQAKSEGYREIDKKVVTYGSASVTIDEKEVIKINGDGTEKTRGLHVAVINEQDGSVVKKEHFKTHYSSDKASRFAKLIEEIPVGRIVAIAVCDEASRYITGEDNGTRNQAAIDACKNLGSKKIEQLKYRDSWALIGYKGLSANTTVEVLSKDYPAHIRLTQQPIELEIEAIVKGIDEKHKTDGYASLTLNQERVLSVGGLKTEGVYLFAINTFGIDDINIIDCKRFDLYGARKQLDGYIASLKNLPGNPMIIGLSYNGNPIKKKLELTYNYRFCTFSTESKSRTVAIFGYQNKNSVHLHKEDIKKINEEKRLRATVTTWKIVRERFDYQAKSKRSFSRNNQISQISTEFSKRWMEKYYKMNPSEESLRLLSKLNLAGTHNSGAINSIITTPYACQDASITDQLNQGIRILDIRIQVYQNWEGTYDFSICHGAFFSSFGFNKYAPLEEVLIDIDRFLKNNEQEVIVVILSVDDWCESYFTSINKEDSYEEIKKILKKFVSYRIPNQESPKYSDYRGKMLLLNRINKDVELGIPVSWDDNTDKQKINVNDTFTIRVQDRYKGYKSADPDKEKYDIFKEEMDEYEDAKEETISINFGSGVTGLMDLIGVSVVPQFMTRLGDIPRPRRIGWTLYDYATQRYLLQAKDDDSYYINSVVDLVISSNFDYEGIEEYTFDSEL